MIKKIVPQDQDAPNKLLKEISHLIESARTHASRELNITHVMLNWHIGVRINEEILKNERAEYGKQITKVLADKLKIQYGQGYDTTSLNRMSKFSRLYPNEQIVSALSQRLSWSHIKEIIVIEDNLKRDFYAEMCRIQDWDVRTLRNKIDKLLFERTALSKKPEHLIKQEIDNLRITNNLTPDFIFHDPCLLEFVGLKPDYAESDLENAILDELIKFLQEFGNDFCFITRQKRMSTDDTDKFLDLLFFHRGLRRLIACELKIGRFEPSHKGQMEWYLNWLDRHERKPGEERPLGIILCADKKEGDVEYLELSSSGIHVAQYLTELPPIHVLEEKLKKAIEIAREKFERLHLANNQNDKSS